MVAELKFILPVTLPCAVQRLTYLALSLVDLSFCPSPRCISIASYFRPDNGRTLLRIAAQ